MFLMRTDHWKRVPRFAWILTPLFLTLHAKCCAFIAIGNEISQSFNIVHCNSIQDKVMSLNSEWNSNVERYLRDSQYNLYRIVPFSPGGHERIVEYKIHNMIFFTVSISREPFVLKMHNSLALFFSRFILKRKAKVLCARRRLYYCTVNIKVEQYHR